MEGKKAIDIQEIEDNVYSCAGRSFLTMYDQFIARGIPLTEHFAMLAREYKLQLDAIRMAVEKHNRELLEAHDK